ncbi:MAG: hypothetical protein P4L67_05210 [Candidatus Pacebacteria bacterium]|nr:hypothetical protein [Candidatus Paceibacterota bacterium]
MSMTLHQLADELLEIRRYVRSHPKHVKERMAVINDRDIVNVGRYHPFHRKLKRMATNVNAGLDRIVVDPEILEGYLYGAAAEIRELAIKLETTG